MHRAQSESAGHDPSQSYPGPDPSMFFSDPSHDPSHSTRSKSAVISFPDPYVPATVASGRRPHYRKGVRGYRAIARRLRRAGAGGALPYPRGAAMLRGFNSRGRPRVVPD
jgi:hypothetical protein